MYKNKITAVVASCAFALGSVLSTANQAVASALNVTAIPELPQWHHDAVSSKPGVGATGKGVTVAVLDTGVDGTHPEFAGRMVPGFNALTLKPFDPYVNNDLQGHGTHVAGIIGAAANGTGISGVSPNVKIMPVRVLGFGGVTDPLSVGIRWAVDNGADIINMSLGFESGQELELDETVCNSVKYASDNGVLVVVAAGNSGTVGNPEHYPAGCEKALAVASLDQTLRPSWFTSYDQFISLAAPGTDVYSTLPLSGSSWYTPFGYGAMSGTSMAAPVVSGVAALVLEAKSNATPSEVKSILESSALDLLSEGQDAYTGFGLVNAARAVNLAVSNSVPELEVNPLTQNFEILPVITNHVFSYDGSARISIAPGLNSASFPHSIETWDVVSNSSTLTPLNPRQVRATIPNIPDTLILMRAISHTPSGDLQGPWVQLSTPSWYKGLTPFEPVFPIGDIELSLENVKPGSIEITTEWSKKGFRVLYMGKKVKPFKVTVSHNKINYSKVIKNPSNLGSVFLPAPKIYSKPRDVSVKIQYL